MKVKQVLEFFNNDRVVAAAAIGYTPQAFDHWIRKRRIPFKAQRFIEAATGGALVAVWVDKKKKREL